MESYDDAITYYSGRTDLAENTRHFYLSVINKLRTYHLNGELPMHRICKGHFPESDYSKGVLNLLPAYERLDEFISGYRDEGYSDTFIAGARRIVQRVIVLSRTIEWNSFQEIKDWYRNQRLSKRYLYDVFSALDKFEHGIRTTTIGTAISATFAEF